jgi:hypothetical protein
VEMGVRPGPDGTSLRGWVYGCKEMDLGIVRPRVEAVESQEVNQKELLSFDLVPITGAHLFAG